MEVKHFLAALIFVVIIYNVYSGVAVLEAELRKEVKLNFGKGMFLIKRRTKAFDGPQYLFASPKQDGSWTTDGKTKIPSTAHLYWNGTLVFTKFTKDDIGSYEMPLEALLGLYLCILFFANCLSCFYCPNTKRLASSFICIECPSIGLTFNAILVRAGCFLINVCIILSSSINIIIFYDCLTHGYNKVVPRVVIYFWWFDSCCSCFFNWSGNPVQVGLPAYTFYYFLSNC